MTSVVESSAPSPQRSRRGAHTRSRRHALARVSRSRTARIGLPLVAALAAVVAALAFAFPTLSNWYASRAQDRLAAQLDQPAIVGAIAHGTVGAGQPLSHIAIPAIGIDVVMVQGVDAGSLSLGPGHYPGTPLPCTIGNVAIAGHRTTFLHPFGNLDRLRAGDIIEIRTPTVSCTYAVASAPYAVSPNDLAVVANTPGQYTLTLTTCTPRGSAAQRLVVKAVMLPASLRPAPSSVSGNAA
ncbi:MAG: sortase [Acidimicrobiales bacterium]